MNCYVLLLVFASCGVCMANPEPLLGEMIGTALSLTGKGVQTFGSVMKKIPVFGTAFGIAESVMTDVGMMVIKVFVKASIPVFAAVGRSGIVKVMKLINKIGLNVIKSGKKLLNKNWKSLVPTAAPYLGSLDDLICAWKDIAKSAGVSEDHTINAINDAYIVANGLFAG